MPEDAVTAAPQVYKVVAEDDRVRVLESRLKPGEKTAVHGHPEIVAIALTNSSVRFTGPDGETAEAELPAGAPMIFEATEHTTENIGSEDAVVIIVELK